MKLHLNRNDMDLGIVKPRNKTNAEADEPLREFSSLFFHDAIVFFSFSLCYMVSHEDFSLFS